MFHLFILLIVSCFLKGHQGYRHQRNGRRGSNLVVIVDSVSDLAKWAYREKFKYGLCNLWGAGRKLWAQTYTITVRQRCYDVELLCSMWDSPGFSPHHSCLKSETAGKPYPEAFSEARRLTNGSGSSSVIVMVTHTDNCQLFGCWKDDRCVHKGGCMCKPDKLQTADCYSVNNAKTDYDKRFYNSLASLQSNGANVIVLGVGVDLSASYDRWKDVTVRKVSSYDNLPNVGLSKVEKVVKTLVESWTTITSEERRSTRNLTMESTATSIFPATQGTGCWPQALYGMDGSDAYPHTNGVGWLMMIPVALIGIAIILCIVYIGLVIYYKHKQPDRSLIWLITGPHRN